MRHVNDTDNLKRGVKEIIENRRPCGIHVIATGRGPIFTYQLYDCMYTDGHSEVRRGDNLRTYHGFQDLNGTKKEIKEASESLRPDLEAAMRAIHVLQERISNHCWDMDMPTGYEMTVTGLKRAPRRNRTNISALRKRRSGPLNQKGKKK